MLRRPSSSVVLTILCLALLLLILLVVPVTSSSTGGSGGSGSSSSVTPPSLLWSFSYTIVGSDYSVSTFDVVLTGPQHTFDSNLVGSGGPCFNITHLQGVRNASVVSRGLETAHLTNVGTPNTTSYFDANEVLFLNEPQFDQDGRTIDFDAPFTKNGHSATSTNLFYSDGRYVEYSDLLDAWQTVSSSSFSLTLLTTNVSAYNNMLSQYNGQCLAPSTLIAIATSSSSSTNGAGNTIMTAASTASPAQSLLFLFLYRQACERRW